MRRGSSSSVRGRGRTITRRTASSVRRIMRASDTTVATRVYSPTKRCPIVKGDIVAISRLTSCFGRSKCRCPSRRLTGNKTSSVRAFYRVCYRRTRTRSVQTRITFARTVGRAKFLRFNNSMDVRRFGFTKVKAAKKKIPKGSCPSIEAKIETRVRRLGTCTASRPLGRAYISGHCRCIGGTSTPCMR